MTMNSTCVMGLGNPLFQDEGVGIHIIHELMQGDLAGQVELIDGGTDGLALLGVVEDAERLLVIDAIDGEYPPGTIKRLENEEIPMLSQAKVSPHQASFQEVLALARFRGRLPSQLVLIGVQAKSLDWGTSLNPEVSSSVPAVMQMVHEQVDRWSK